MRYLGIDSNTRGLAFAVLESDQKLIDWGIKQLSRKPVDIEPKLYEKKKLQKRLRIVESLIERYRPDAIVIEDWTAKDSRRASSVKKFICRVEKIAARQEIKIYSFSRTALFDALAKYEIKTKYELAVFLGRYFPELALRIPGARATWMSESVWLSVFKAVCFCFLQIEKER